MEIFTVVTFFIIGVLVGVFSTITFALFLAKRSLDKMKVNTKKKELNESTKESKVESVNSRMKKVKELINEQLDLNAKAGEPSKNAMHSKYKNSLIARLKEIENEKTEILRSIIADGFDPIITVMDEVGVVTNIKLSEFLAENSQPTPPPKVPTKPSTARHVGKFTIIKGGKGDDGGTTH